MIQGADPGGGYLHEDEPVLWVGDPGSGVGQVPHWREPAGQS